MQRIPAQLVSLGQAPPPPAEPKPRRRVSGARLAATALGSVLLCLVFRFPAVLVAAFGLGAVAVVLAGRVRRGTPISAVAYAAAFLAQATSIFVTPFAWPLRFAFFALLLGALTALAAWQLRDVARG